MADAQITVGANADAATRAAAVCKAAWVEAGHAITSAMGSAAQQVISDLAGVATAQGKINFASQHSQVRDFEQATARLAVSMGRDLEGVRGNIEGVGVSIGKRPQEVAMWASEVGRLTYNFAGAVDAQKGLAELAAKTGRQVSDYRGLAVELANVAKVGGDTTDVIGRIAAQSENLKNAGGVAAFTDQIEGLSDMLSKLGGKSTEAFLKVTSLAGALGKGLDPQQAQRAQQQAFGAVTADPRRWELYLHKNLRDEHGQMKEGDLPTVMKQIVEETKKRFGKDAKRVLMQDQNFGSLGGAQLFNTDWNQVEQNATASQVSSLAKPKSALDTYKATDAGKRESADAALSVSSRNLMGSSTLLGKAADSLQQFASKNPFTSTLITSALTAGSSTFMGAMGKQITNMMGSGGGGGAVGGAGRLLGGGALAAAAVPLAVGAAVLGAGLYGINKFDTAMDERQESQEKAASSEQKNKNDLAKAAATRKQRIAQLEKGGVAHGYAVAVAGLESEAASHGGRAQGMDGPALAAAIEKAIKAGLKDAKFNVTTRADTPVEVAGAGGHAPAAGNQG